jgi:hypothetical protein
MNGKDAFECAIIDVNGVWHVELLNPSGPYWVSVWSGEAFSSLPSDPGEYGWSLFETHYQPGDCPLIPEILNETTVGVNGDPAGKDLTTVGSPFPVNGPGDCFPSPYNFQTSGNSTWPGEPVWSWLVPQSD